MVHFASNSITTEEDISRLHHAMQQYKRNVFTILLAAFYCACRELQERKNLLIYVMTAQRESFFPAIDIQRAIGFFADTYPICIEAGETKDSGYAAIVQVIKETLLGVPKGGLDYFMLKHMSMQERPHSKLDHAHPILFHYLNLLLAPQSGDFFTPPAIASRTYT